jgi:hypothetical protein
MEIARAGVSPSKRNANKPRKSRQLDDYAETDHVIAMRRETPRNAQIIPPVNPPVFLEKRT